MPFTLQSVLAHNTRVAAGRARRLNCGVDESGVISPLPGVEDESDLHRDIIDECNRRGWLFFHGSMAHKTRRTEGEADFTILTDLPTDDYRKRVLFIECKNKRGKRSPAQQNVAAHAKKLGHTVHLVNNFEGFLRLLQ